MTKNLVIGILLKICFVDESGCTGQLPSATSHIQPAFVIGGLIIDYEQLSKATIDYLGIKKQFFPTLMNAPQYMGNILKEVKGSSARAQAAQGGRNSRRHAMGYLDKTIKLCEEIDCKLIGRVWIKEIGTSINGRSIYTASIQRIFDYFQKYLEYVDDTGIIVVDSRLKHLNSQVAHSIFTQKFKTTGDNYDRILELPLFAHSDNHAGLQLSDTMFSGLIFPLAVQSYCVPYIHSVHTRPRYAGLKDMFGVRLRAMQFMYHNDGKWNGGIVTSDPLGTKSSRELFV